MELPDYEKLISEKAAGVRMSAIKEMAMRSARVEGAASLAWGLPSFRTPEYIRSGVIERLNTDVDVGKYALPDGLKELREQIVLTHAGRTGVTVDAEANVMITAGNMQGMSSLMSVLINPGDEIILTDPCFPSHIQQILLNGGKPVYWPLDEAHDWCLDIEALPGLITTRTKAIVMVSPSNPTGRVFSKEKLLQLGEIARRRGIMVLVDDPYSHFLYENQRKYFNLASVPELRDNLVYLFTFSKAYAMSGWRLGYMILPQAIKREVLKVHDLNIICTPRISQVAGLAALSGEPGHLAEFNAALSARRELICERLDALPHVFGYVKPQGAYYVFPRIRVEHQDSHAFCLQMLNESKVTMTPGSAFGPSGEHHVRMAFCVDEDTINLAFDRIGARFGSGA